MAGGVGTTAAAYCGGIDLNFTTERLLSNVRGYLDRGFNAVKIKVGRESLDDDVERVRAVRDLIGPEAVFMVDANYSMTREEAIRAAIFRRSYLGGAAGRGVRYEHHPGEGGSAHPAGRGSGRTR